MTAPRQHHPSCAARWGGRCTACPTDAKQRPVTPPASTVTCSHGVPHIVTGETLEIRERALAEWDDRCGCDKGVA